MSSRKIVAQFAALALLVALALLPGCSINVKDKDKEGRAAVDIKTPMGDLHVNEQPDVREIGLAQYPGARPAQKENSEDKKSANVNLSVPGFDLKVVAAEYESDDSPDKILAYYHKELQKYGKPIECHGRWNGGNVHTSGGKDDLSKPVTCGSEEHGNSVELKVGTEGNQHIVAVEPRGTATHFALVYVRMHAGKEDMI